VTAEFAPPCLAASQHGLDCARSSRIYQQAAEASLADRAGTTVDQREVERFSAMANEWWNPNGKFRPLHKFNPVRIAFVKEQVCVAFRRELRDPQALAGLRLLDIGCGGGLLCEPMTRLGADVTGIDPAAGNIEIASLHAARSGLAIDYRAQTAEDLAANGERFDVVLNMEVVEHVANLDLFIDACASLLRPGGLMIVATINRTLKAWALAIVAAENILRWLPRGTHRYDKLVTPAELEQALSGHGLGIIQRTGVSYNPFADQWNLSQDMDVNYMVVARRHDG
jgi:2-polyprenyl-6-hydroxyphenyl methylase / 3-demethylubiquinone-9 3-methyltransferase